MPSLSERPWKGTCCMRPRFVVILGSLLVSCTGPSLDQSAWQALPAAQRQAAQALYAQRCATCHGLGGQGDGPSARGIDPKDFSSADWPAQLDDQTLHNHIITGTDQGMPRHPDLRDDERMPALLLYLKQFNE